MRFFMETAVLLVANLVFFLVSADVQPKTITFPHHHRRGKAKGAVYFMNNDPTRNYLFAADIWADATFTLRKAYYAGGKGANGRITGIPDALLSQGSVIATKHSTGHLDVVVLTNAGSNTVTVFRINPNDPSNLEMLGKPVYSGGDFPNSVAINNAGDMVCALNSGAISGVSCFRLDSRNGIIPLSNTTRFLYLNQTVIPTEPDMTASDVAFTEDDKKLVVAVKGRYDPRKPGYIVVWDVNEDWSLSIEFTRMTGGVWIWALTQVPGRNAFIGGDAITGVEIYDLDALAHNPSAHSRNLQVLGQEAICWSAYSKVTNNFYLVDFAVPSIDEVHLDANLNGTVVAIHQLDQYDGARDFSINYVNGKDRLYLLACNSTSVEAFTIHAPGVLERIQKVNVGTLINEAGLPFDPDYNYGLTSYVVQ